MCPSPHRGEVRVRGLETAMTRRAAVGFFTLALGLFLSSSPAAAQQAGKVARIGYLALPSGPSEATDAFLQGLREHGYVVGQNIAIEYRWAEGKADRLPDLAADLVRLKVDIIVASATPVIQAAKDATRTIPIVMAAAGDPIATGLVASLARPGGNITGLTLLSTELAGKRLQLIKELVPGPPPPRGPGGRPAFFPKRCNPRLGSWASSFSCWRCRVPTSSTAPSRR